MNKQQVYSRLVELSSKGSIPIALLKRKFSKTYSKFIKKHGYTKNSKLLFDFLNPSATQKCAVCEKPTTFSRFSEGYKQYCCKECTYAPGNLRDQKRENTCLEKYGVINVLLSDKVHQKIRATNLEILGVEYPLQSKEIRQQAEDTCTDRYGVNNPLLVPEIRQKGKDTLFENYGVECPFSSPVIRERSKTNVVAKYGVESTNQLEAVKQKKIDTCQRNRGTDYPMQSKEVQKKVENAMLEEYGVPNAFQSPKIQQQIKDTFMQRYNVENAMQHPEFFERNKDAAYARQIVSMGKRKFKLQGYEPQALHLLVNDLRIPVSLFDPKQQHFKYYDNETKKTRWYFPDFQIGDLVVEVKSTYTAGLDGDAKMRRNLLSKLKGVRLAGKDFLLLVMNGNGTLYKCCFNSFKLVSDVNQYRGDLICSAVSSYLPPSH